VLQTETQQVHRPSLGVMRDLLVRDAEVRYCDPHVPQIDLDGTIHRSVDWSPAEVERADCVVVLTAHEQFTAEPLWDHAGLVVDTRNVVPAGPKVHKI
jgi:UDP-N-acetyl-D-glucosamine dehydrogenase